MEPSPETKALSNPIIVGEILSHLKTTRNHRLSLRLVSKIWKEEGTRILRSKFGSEIQITIKVQRETRWLKRPTILDQFIDCIKHSTEGNPNPNLINPGITFPCINFCFEFEAGQTIEHLKTLCEFQKAVGASLVRHLGIKMSSGTEVLSEVKREALEAFLISFQNVESLEIHGVHLMNSNIRYHDRDMTTADIDGLPTFQNKFELAQLKLYKCHSMGFGHIVSEILRRAPNLEELSCWDTIPRKYLTSFGESQSKQKSQTKLVVTSFHHNFDHRCSSIYMGELLIFEKLSVEGRILIRQISLTNSGISFEDPQGRRVAAISRILRANVQTLESVKMLLTPTILEEIHWPVLTKVKEFTVEWFLNCTQLPPKFVPTYLPNLEIFNLPYFELNMSAPMDSVTVIQANQGHMISDQVIENMPRFFPNVKKLVVGRVHDLPSSGKILWAIEKLEEVDLKIDVTDHILLNMTYHLFPRLDCFFTGLSLSKEEAIRLLERPGNFLSEMPPKEGPAIFECKALKKIKLRFFSDRPIYTWNFFTSISYDFGFRNLPAECTVDISGRCGDVSRTFMQGVWMEKIL